MTRLLQTNTQTKTSALSETEAGADTNFTELKSGYLMKTKSGRKWNLRYFVLTDKDLRYYEDEHAYGAIKVPYMPHNTTTHTSTTLRTPRDRQYLITTTNFFYVLTSYTTKNNK